jgi:hypothetical protein
VRSIGVTRAATRRLGMILASHRATGGMVKVSSNRLTRRSHRPAPKKINHDGY